MKRGKDNPYTQLLHVSQIFFCSKLFIFLMRSAIRRTSVVRQIYHQNTLSAVTAIDKALSANTHAILGIAVPK